MKKTTNALDIKSTMKKKTNALSQPQVENPMVKNQAAFKE